MKPTKRYARKLTTCACGRPGVKIVDRTSVCDRCLAAGRDIRARQLPKVMKAAVFLVMLTANVDAFAAQVIDVHGSPTRSTVRRAGGRPGRRTGSVV